jgi:hypothetical protein
VGEVLRFSLSYPVLSFAFASMVVYHCTFAGSSLPPRLRGLTWSTTYPRQAPDSFPVAGQGRGDWQCLERRLQDGGQQGKKVHTRLSASLPRCYRLRPSQFVAPVPSNLVL